MYEDSTGTPNAIYSGAAAAQYALSQADADKKLQQRTDEHPLHDTVRVWVAPYDGTISVSGAVQLVQDTSKSRADYGTKADDVRVAIQARGDELWSARIAGDDYGVKTPANVTAIPVRKGDRLYFRVQSVFDGAYDRVSWAPRIDYVGADASVDANGKLPKL